MEIKKLRLAAKLSQQAVANHLGVDRTTVTCWENETSMPRADLLPKLADVLHCTIDALFGRDKNTA